MTRPASPVEMHCWRLFEQATDYALAHPDVVLRFYPPVQGTPGWVEVNSAIALYELTTGRFARVRVTAEHAEGQTVAFHAHGARAHVNSSGWRMLTGVGACTDPHALRAVWLEALRRRARRFEPDLSRASVHATVANALETLR